MTFVELLLSLCVVAGGCGVLVALGESLRADHAELQTRNTLTVLRARLVEYRTAHDAWPVGDAATVLALLEADPGVGPSVRRLPRHDGYGRPWVYRLHNGQADFLSFGGDGRLGDPNSSDPDLRAAAADNLYGVETQAAQP